MKSWTEQMEIIDWEILQMLEVNYNVEFTLGLREYLVAAFYSYLRIRLRFLRPITGAYETAGF